jgi:hypothetical protein
MKRFLEVVQIALALGVLRVPTPAHCGTGPSQAEGRKAPFAVRGSGSASGDVKARLWGSVAIAQLEPDLSIRCGPNGSRYPWKMSIISTVFWIGETGSGPTNARSAWDANWMADYGGVDDPRNRKGFEPVGFVPHQNPFYVALPYCDMQNGQLKNEAAKVVPWFIEGFRGQNQSVCKGRWLEIRHGIKLCYAQWEDAGPFRTDHAKYVFGEESPAANLNHGAGIDVSPAVRDFLGLRSLDVVDWKFVEQAEVPAGPWSMYGLAGKAVASTGRRMIGKTYLERGRRVIVLARWGKAADRGTF